MAGRAGGPRSGQSAPGAPLPVGQRLGVLPTAPSSRTPSTACGRAGTSRRPPAKSASRPSVASPIASPRTASTGPARSSILPRSPGTRRPTSSSTMTQAARRSSPPCSSTRTPSPSVATRCSPCACRVVPRGVGANFIPGIPPRPGEDRHPTAVYRYFSADGIHWTAQEGPLLEVMTIGNRMIMPYTTPHRRGRPLGLLQGRGRGLRADPEGRHDDASRRADSPTTAFPWGPARHRPPHQPGWLGLVADRGHHRARLEGRPGPAVHGAGPR